jgi:hypothetical protein
VKLAQYGSGYSPKSSYTGQSRHSVRVRINDKIYMLLTVNQQSQSGCDGTGVDSQDNHLNKITEGDIHERTNSVSHIASNGFGGICQQS